MPKKSFWPAHLLDSFGYAYNWKKKNKEIQKISDPPTIRYLPKKFYKINTKHAQQAKSELQTENFSTVVSKIRFRIFFSQFLFASKSWVEQGKIKAENWRRESKKQHPAKVCEGINFMAVENSWHKIMKHKIKLLRWFS